MPRIPVTVSEPRPHPTPYSTWGHIIVFGWLYHLSQEAPTLERNDHTRTSCVFIFTQFPLSRAMGIRLTLGFECYPWDGSLGTAVG